MPLTAEQRAALERVLVRQRARLLRRLGMLDERLKVDEDAHGLSQHLAEQASAAADREHALILATEEGRALRRTLEALRRLYDDPASFGTCLACGEEIAYARLEALPEADLCIECKRTEESGGDVGA